MAPIEAVLSVASSAALAAVGAVLLATRPRRPGGGAFAAFTLLWGLALSAFNLPAWVPSAVSWSFPVGFALLLPLPVLTVHFATEFPMGGAKTAWRATLGLAAAMAGVAVGFALAPERFVSELPLAVGTGARLDFTLLATVVGIVPQFASLYLALVLMARSYRAATKRLHRTELAVVVGALGSYLAFTTPFFLVALWPNLGGGDARVLVQFAMFVGGAIALAYAASVLLRLGGNAGARRVVGLLGVSGALGIIAALPTTVGAPPLVIHGLIRVLVAGIITYGILKHQIFGLDLKFKKGIKTATPAAIFAGVYFLVGELTENLVANATGSAAIAFTISAILVVLEGKFFRTGMKVAHLLFPRVEATPDYLDDRRETVYRAALESVAADGTLTERESRILAATREQLGISAEASARIASEVFGTSRSPLKIG